MPEFEKSKNCEENHVVVHNGDAIPFHNNEIGKLYRNLENACDRRTGYGTWEWQNDKSRVIADSDGLTIQSVLRDGTVKETKMNYGDGRNLLRAIEKQVGIEKDLETMS